MRRPRAVFLVLVVLAGCRELPPPGENAKPDPRDRFYRQPLAVQQQQVYDETVTGRFVSLIDLEDTVVDRDETIERGTNQLGHFTIDPPAGGRIRHVLDVTRTGAGAMEVLLPPRSMLVFRPPHTRDFRRFTVLSLAVHAPAVRDDLLITLTNTQAAWHSSRRLVSAGWNTVMIDLARLQRRGTFDLANVRTIQIRFASAGEAVRFHIDDVMLIDNRRRIAAAPPAIVLSKTGLDYTLALPGWTDSIHIAMADDGLWRLGRNQGRVQLAAAGEELTSGGEDLRAMGDRKVGAVELVEANSLRLRIRNTWYFPPQAGEWTDMAIRQIRWDYTFYPDGRWVTSVMLNNAGGRELGGIRVTTPTAVAWSNGSIDSRLEVADFAGPVGVWAYLAAPPGPDGDTYRANFARPIPATCRLGRPDPWAAGDADHDGFDESQGCYFARSTGGNCRVELAGRGDPLRRPVIYVAGPWKGPVAANCAGLPLRPVARLPDGVLAIVPDTLTTPTIIEFTGPVGLLDE